MWSLNLYQSRGRESQLWDQSHFWHRVAHSTLLSLGSAVVSASMVRAERFRSLLAPLEILRLGLWGFVVHRQGQNGASRNILHLCSGYEEGSHSKLIDFFCHLTPGSKVCTQVLKKKDRKICWAELLAGIR